MEPVSVMAVDGGVAITQAGRIVMPDWAQLPDLVEALRHLVTSHAVDGHLARHAALPQGGAA